MELKKYALHGSGALLLLVLCALPVTAGDPPLGPMPISQLLAPLALARPA